MSSLFIIVCVTLALTPQSDNIRFVNEVTIIGEIVDFLPEHNCGGVRDVFLVRTQCGWHTTIIACFMKKSDLLRLRGLAHPGDTIVAISGHIGHKRIRCENRTFTGVFVRKLQVLR